MEHFTVLQYCIICSAVFFAGMVDSIAGGGGLISIPAYLFIGLPPHYTLGTNKLSSTIGTSFAAIRFIKSGNIELYSVLASVVFALVGSPLGARLTLFLDPKWLKIIMTAAIPVIMIVVFLKRDIGESPHTPASRNRLVIIGAVCGLVIGMYDGFFGPGTGTFLILAYVSLLGLDPKTASGNAKLVNLSSNAAALVTFMISGKVVYSVGLAAAACGVAGNWLGAGMAIRKGARIIKPIFLFIMLALLVKIVLDLLKKSI